MMATPSTPSSLWSSCSTVRFRLSQRTCCFSVVAWGGQQSGAGAGFCAVAEHNKKSTGRTAFKNRRRQVVNREEIGMALQLTTSYLKFTTDNYRSISAGASRKRAAAVSDLTGVKYTSLKVYDFDFPFSTGRISMCQ